MKIAIGSDHAGFPLKKELAAYLRKKGHTVKDVGVFNTRRSDYPDYAQKAAQCILSGEYERGILSCGSGVGMCISANKIHGIRAVVCTEPYSAVMSRRHNDTNVLCLGSRVVGIELAQMIVDQWLAAEYEGGRHQKRVDKMKRLEDQY